MTLIEKILFVSDYIEPTRMYPSCVRVRELAFIDLDRAVYKTIDDSIKFHDKTGGTIPPIAYQAKTYYEKLGGNYDKT